ncbi:MAG: hypothetical protein LBQ93_07165 [Treponema sp.]|nr:hypothetical protein [Treponema sp.]
MSKEAFEKASTLLWEKLEKDGYSGIMQYKPFSDQYWNEKYKIVICNYENLGFADIKVNTVTHIQFKGWVEYKKSKTAHFTAVFANSLKSIMEQKNFSITDMKKSYWEVEKIWNSMKNMMYMNIRPTSGANSGRQNKPETHNLIKKYKEEIKNFIDSLDADIFVITSKDSVFLFNYLYDLDKEKLTFNGKTRVNNMFVYSLRHFGWFFSYPYYYKKASEVFYDIYKK